MEEASECIVRPIDCDDGSRAVADPDVREPLVRTSESDDSGRGSPEEQTAAPSEAGSETSSGSAVSEDEEGAVEEIGWVAMRHLELWEVEMVGPEEQTGTAGSAILPTGSIPTRSQKEDGAPASDCHQEQRQPTQPQTTEKKKMEKLPVGRCVDVGACIVFADLAFRPRYTLIEWFGPYLNVIRRALPLSRGYVVMPKFERIPKTKGIPLPYLEVCRIVSQRPVKLQSVLIVFGKNEPAGRAWFPSFSGIVQSCCSVLCRRILQRNQEGILHGNEPAKMFWLGFFGFWWNFGVQGEAQEVEVLSSETQEWIDMDAAVSCHRLQQLATVIDEAFPLCSDEKAEGTSSKPNPVAVLMEHFSQLDDSHANRILWNGPWIELLSRVFPGKNGYVVQPEAVDTQSAKDPPLLRVIKTTIDDPAKGKISLDTVLLLVSRGKKGPLPKTCGKTVSIDEAQVKAYMETVFDPRFPTRWLCVPITLPVYWIYAAGTGWIGGVVSPNEERASASQTPEPLRSVTALPSRFNFDESSESDDSSESEEEEEAAFKVEVLSEWNRTAYSRQSLRTLRQLAQLTKTI